MLKVLGNALIHVSRIPAHWQAKLFAAATYVQEVLDSTVWVVKCSAHGSIDLASLKAHCLHVRDRLGTLIPYGQRIGVVVVGVGAPGSRSRCRGCSCRR